MPFTPENIAATIGALTVLVSTIGATIAAVVKLWRRDNVTDDRLDRLWNSHITRGLVEAATNNLIAPAPTLDGSDLKLTPDVIVAYAPIAPALKALRAKMPTATPGQLGEAIEKEFGTWLSVYICPVIRVSNYACLAIAKVIAEQSDDDKKKR